MFDDVITLKSNPTASYDSAGNEILTYTDRSVYAVPRTVYQSEFYNAAQAGMHPTMAFRLAVRDAYDGEKLLEYRSKLYTVIRVDWRADRDYIDLICEERIKNG